MFIAIFQNQNECVKVHSLLKKRGIQSDIIATPRKFLRAGSCSYCLRFHPHDIDKVRQSAKSAGIPILAIYKL
ncbi:MAG: DUF3343 domain-containing protein [Clostridiaceae bacterium]|nr:DUF3343 domain-containing protein [Clostridiaceae bacterium]